MTMMGTIRFLVGAGLVAAGGTLAMPLVERLVAASREPAAIGSPGMPSPGGGAGAPLGPSQPQPPALSVADPGFAPQAFDAESPSAGGAPEDGNWLQLDRCPPPPPAPLPPPPQELVRSNPAMGAAYRSTLDVPPPPLLDSEAPPPATAWPVVAASATVPVAAPTTELTVPATYRVRDGDDLGSIAGRFYGHPAAASAIWAANREVIPHPDLLPIGVELRLPPPWAVAGHGRSVAGAIEPAAHVRPSEMVAPAPTPAATAAPWLAPVPATPVPTSAVSTTPMATTPVSMTPVPVTPVSTAVPTAAGRQAAGVVVGPGESLSSLARRLYGDPAMADRIFAANRDRLRSPDLVVPGMELRLPPAVTAPLR